MARPQSVDGVRIEAFDPSLAIYETVTVRTDELIDLLEVTHAGNRIDEYRRAMRAGDRFPPVSVVRLAGRLFIADGHKRFQAYRGLGEREIPVEVWPKRRWLGDQWQQLRRKTRAQFSLLRRVPRDPQARAAARRLFWDTVGHWRRVGASLARAARRRESRAQKPGFRSEGRGPEG